MARDPGSEGRPTWEQRNATVKALIDRGWAERLMIGHDYAPGMVRAGAAPSKRDEPTRYLFVSTVALPALRGMGVDDETIELITREVPRRFLSGAG